MTALIGYLYQGEDEYEVIRKIVLLSLIAGLIIACTATVSADDEHYYDYYYDDEYHFFEEHFYRGRVLEVSELEETDPLVGISKQYLQVMLTSGPYKGEVVTVESHYFPGDPMLDLMLTEGQEVIVVTTGEHGLNSEFYIQDVARDRGVYYLIGVFVLLLLVLGRLKGVKTVITLVITVLLIFKVLLPLLLQGYNPIWLAISIASAAIFFTLVVVGGWNMKSAAAIIGTIAGVMVAGLMAFWAGSVSHLTGLGSSEAQMLYFLDHTINFRGLLFAGIIIGSLGAVTDTGMSVASAAAEIRLANPDIKFKELFVSALNVGRDVMGTMANTLILAYVGAATPMLLLVMGYQIEWLKIVNLDMIATEFVRGVAGSIGLVVAVPITAAVAAFLMTKDWPEIVKVERR